MFQPEQGLSQSVPAYGRGKATVIERILKTLQNIRCIRKRPDNLYSRRMPLIGEDRIDQVMAEIHTICPVVCVRQRPVLEGDERARWKNQQIPLLGHEFAIDGANDSF